MKLRDDEYKKLLRRWSALTLLMQSGGLSPELEAERAALNKQLSVTERVHITSLRRLTNDYDQVAAMGDLGGVELL